MRPGFRERLGPLVCIGLVAAAAPAALELAVGTHPVQLTARLHVFAVGFGAFAATVAAVALSVAGARRRDGRAVLTATALAIMAGLLALHGLATPGIFAGVNGVIALTGGLTLPIGGLALLLSTAVPAQLLRRVGPLLVFEGLAIAGLLALGASALAYPDFVPQVPEPNSFSAVSLLALGVMAFGLLVLRALRIFLLTRRPADLGVVVGLVWLMTALVPALMLNYTQLGWWLGHGLELDGIFVVGAIVALDLARSTRSRPLAADAKAAELVRTEEVFLGSHVRALTVRLAEKDIDTARHSRRVALLAVQVGELLGLSTGRLRSLAAGGLVHDIGKLSVPDTILKEPAALAGEEPAVVRRHPATGSRLLRELGGFHPAVVRLVHGHHERLDGSGHPDGLAGDELDLETRILAVCDVYDALVSPRANRPPWTHEDAVALLRREAGTTFDPRCVAALEQVLIRAWADRGPVGHEQTVLLPLAVSPRSVVRPACLGGWGCRRPSATPRRSDGDIAQERQDVPAFEAVARGSGVG